MKPAPSFGQAFRRPALGLAALLASLGMPSYGQAAEPAAVSVLAWPSLVATRRIASPSLGAVSYVQQVKKALIELAHEHPEVQSAQAAADTGNFEVEAARRARYPRFKMGTTSGTYDAGGAGGNSKSYQLITADVRMSLLDGGVMSARVRAAESGSKAQSEAVKSTSQKVVLDALTAYLQVQRADLKKQIAGKSTQVLDELSRAEQRRVALGAAGQNDLRMAAARRAGIAAREMDFEAQRGEAMAKFETFFRFRPNIGFLPMLVVPAQWRIASQQDALQQAEARSTELTEARGRVERAQALVEQQEASIYPTLDAVLAKTKDPRGVSPSEPTRAAFELSWNFGNGFDQQFRVKAALAEVSNQEAKLEGAKLNLFELASSSWGRTVAGREREKQLLLAVNESGQAFKGRRRLLEFGRETLPNVLDAQVDYYNLLLDYVDAVFDLRITEFRLARTTGQLWISPEEGRGWVDRVFVGSQRPMVTDEGLLSFPCMVSAAQCKSDDVAVAGAGARLALRRAPRLRER